MKWWKIGGLCLAMSVGIALPALFSSAYPLTSIAHRSTSPYIFTGKYSNLGVVIMRFDDPISPYIQKYTGNIVFTLRETHTGRVVYTTQVPLQDIYQIGTYHFGMPLIDNSQYTQYSIHIAGSTKKVTHTDLVYFIDRSSLKNPFYTFYFVQAKLFGGISRMQWWELCWYACMGGVLWCILLYGTLLVVQNIHLAIFSTTILYVHSRKPISDWTYAMLLFALLLYGIRYISNTKISHSHFLYALILLLLSAIYSSIGQLTSAEYAGSFCFLYLLAGVIIHTIKAFFVRHYAPTS